MVADVVLWLELWSYSCGCGSVFAAVILWLQQVIWLQQLMWLQLSSYGYHSAVVLW